MSYKIEKAIPIPKAEQGRKQMYPFGEMKVGDSFTFPEEKLGSVSQSAHTYGYRNGVKFSVRKKHLRVWRVE